MRELVVASLELPMQKKLSELLIYLRSQTSSDTDEALTDYLNERLPPRNQKFSRETIRRWVAGTQSIGKPNQAKLAQSLGCTFKSLENYLKGNISLEELEIARGGNSDNTGLLDQLLNIAEKLSLIELGQALAKLGELFASRWNLTNSSEKTREAKGTSEAIADLVKEYWDDCVNNLTGAISEDRLKAIANGEKPTLEELEPLSTVLPRTFEDLEIIWRNTFCNGKLRCANCN